MSNLLRRLPALALCICLLTGCAAADSGISAYSYALNITMNADEYPAADQSLLTGIADLFNMLHVSGVYATDGTGFDNAVSLVLSNDEATRTGVEISGTPSHWYINSSLLGSETLMVNNLALLEFAMKAYAHMGMPLQYVALLINPYVHTSAFEWIQPQWTNTFDGTRTRTVSRKDVLALAQYISDQGENTREFYYWVLAIARDIGIDASIFDSLYFLPDWAGRVIDKKGILITVDETSEVWTTGKTTLFTRTVSDGAESWQLTLPADDYGNTLEAAYSHSAEETAFTLTISANAPGDKLSLAVTGDSLPEEFPFTGACSLQFDASGTILPQPVALRFNAISDGYYFIFTQTDATTGNAMLTLSGHVSPVTAPESLSYQSKRNNDNAVNLLSVNDASLAELLSSVARPLISGAWPLLVRLPASSFASLFELLDQYDVLEMVINSLESEPADIQ